MSIIGTLPNNIQNGQLEDATPLMANFNFIVNQINANGNPTGTFTAPSGTRMLFNQAAPPIGWTQETGAAYQDCSVRTVSSGFPGGGVGGSVAWSAWNFGNLITITPFSLSVGNLPSHNHEVSGSTGSSTTSLNHSHGSPTGAAFLTSGGTGLGSGSTIYAQTVGAATANTDLTAHGHNFDVFSSAVGSGTAITPNFTTPQVKYTDYVIGIKS